jgi:hypothetical protein
MPNSSTGSQPWRGPRGPGIGEPGSVVIMSSHAWRSPAVAAVAANPALRRWGEAARHRTRRWRHAVKEGLAIPLRTSVIAGLSKVGNKVPLTPSLWRSGRAPVRRRDEAGGFRHKNRAERDHRQPRPIRPEAEAAGLSGPAYRWPPRATRFQPLSRPRQMGWAAMNSIRREVTAPSI